MTCRTNEDSVQHPHLPLKTERWRPAEGPHRPAAWLPTRWPEPPLSGRTGLLRLYVVLSRFSSESRGQRGLCAGHSRAVGVADLGLCPSRPLACELPLGVKGRVSPVHVLLCDGAVTRVP